MEEKAMALVRCKKSEIVTIKVASSLGEDSVRFIELLEFFDHNKIIQVINFWRPKIFKFFFRSSFSY